MADNDFKARVPHLALLCLSLHLAQKRVPGTAARRVRLGHHSAIPAITE